MNDAAFDPVRIGIVSISDRASSGVYEDKGLPALRDWLSRALLNPIDWEARLIPDEQAVIAATLRELVDAARRAVDELRLGRTQDSLALHQAERWRAELIADDEATTRFAREHAAADLQRLRALVRNARKDAASAPEQRSGRAYRELFQFIREHEADE